MEDSAITTNLEIAMRCLARAGALSDEQAGQAHLADDFAAEICAAHNSGACWAASRAWAHELGRDFDAVAASARNYANGVLTGRLNIT